MTARVFCRGTPRSPSKPVGVGLDAAIRKAVIQVVGDQVAPPLPANPCLAQTCAAQ